MLLHDLVMTGRDCTYKIITKNPDILKALVKLAVSYDGEAMQLIPETLGYLCACEALHALILQVTPDPPFTYHHCRNYQGLQNIRVLPLVRSALEVPLLLVEVSFMDSYTYLLTIRNTHDVA